MVDLTLNALYNLMVSIGKNSLWIEVLEMEDPVTVHYNTLEELFKQPEVRAKEANDEDKKKQPIEVIQQTFRNYSEH